MARETFRGFFSRPDCRFKPSYRTNGNSAAGSVAVGGYHADGSRVPRARRGLWRRRTGRLSRFVGHPLRGDRRIARPHCRGETRRSRLRLPLRIDRRCSRGLKGGFDLVLVRDVSRLSGVPVVAGRRSRPVCSCWPASVRAGASRFLHESTRAARPRRDIDWPVMRGISACCRGPTICTRSRTAGYLRNRSARGGRHSQAVATRSPSCDCRRSR